MRLITHNMMASPVKGAKSAFPLKLDAQQVEVREQEYNEDLVRNMLPKLEWAVLVQTTAQLKQAVPSLPELPAALPDEPDEATLRMVHTALFEVYVLEGTLTCPASGRRFPITNGIPNMLCGEGNQDQQAGEGEGEGDGDEGEDMKE